MLTVARRPGSDEQLIFTEAVECTQGAEGLGYGDVWLLEHHFTRFSLCTSAITMAAFLLGRTDRIRVGSAVTIAPLEHPVMLAERVAMLDHLSGGRFDFGVGRGGAHVRDFDAFGADMSSNHLTSVESMDAVLAAWGDMPFSFAEDGAQLPITPKPVTRPHPPVYVASGSPVADHALTAIAVPLRPARGMSSWSAPATRPSSLRRSMEATPHPPAIRRRSEGSCWRGSPWTPSTTSADEDALRTHRGRRTLARPAAARAALIRGRRLAGGARPSTSGGETHRPWSLR